MNCKDCVYRYKDPTIKEIDWKVDAFCTRFKRPCFEACGLFFDGNCMFFVRKKRIRRRFNNEVSKL